MRDIAINGVGVPILEGGDPADLAPWMESYTNALKQAIGASATGLVSRGRVQFDVPDGLLKVGDAWTVDLGPQFFPGFTVSQPHIAVSLGWPAGAYFVASANMSAAGATIVIHAYRADTIAAPFNVMHVYFEAQNSNVVFGKAAPAVAAAPLGHGATLHTVTNPEVEFEVSGS